ncbi:reverse transcriptase domain-containing protein [Tanacetum coccineum]
MITRQLMQTQMNNLANLAYFEYKLESMPSITYLEKFPSCSLDERFRSYASSIHKAGERMNLYGDFCYYGPEHGEFTIKVPPPLVQKAKQRNFVIHQRDPRHPNIPYPSRMNQEKQKEKDKVQIHKFWQMFKQLHINISLADALILILKYQKMLKSLLSNKEKLIELANIPISENCSAVILKKLPEKLGDPGKFLIPCGFSELKCKALADLGASINLMPLSVWKELGLPKLIPTQMTLELDNRDISTPKGIERDVFVPVGKFTFPADFVIVDYESDPRVPLILGRPFLRTARALIDVHREEMILRDALNQVKRKVPLCPLNLEPFLESILRRYEPFEWELSFYVLLKEQLLENQALNLTVHYCCGLEFPSSEHYDQKSFMKKRGLNRCEPTSLHENQA